MFAFFVLILHFCLKRVNEYLLYKKVLNWHKLIDHFLIYPCVQFYFHASLTLLRQVNFQKYMTLFRSRYKWLCWFLNKLYERKILIWHLQILTYFLKEVYWTRFTAVFILKTLCWLIGVDFYEGFKLKYSTFNCFLHLFLLFSNNFNFLIYFDTLRFFFIRIFSLLNTRLLIWEIYKVLFKFLCSLSILIYIFIYILIVFIFVVVLHHIYFVWLGDAK